MCQQTFILSRHYDRIVKKETAYLRDNPKLMAEWNYEKNGDLNPYELTAFSHRKVWWKCEKGHEWNATVASRTSGKGCPYCIGKKAWKGFNDLSTTHPELAREWHPTKNDELTPFDITFGSDKKVWWVCKEGHEWEATISSRVRGNGCPYCSRKLAISGYNDLATVHPELAREWHPTKNKKHPSAYLPKSNKKVWWRCPKCGYEWLAPVYSRTSGRSCPCCAGHVVEKGINDLVTTHPELAKEWHPTKNGTLNPTNVTHGTDKKVWWKCSECGYEWEAVIYSRTAGNGCPFCAGKIITPGINDLETLYPELAKEWHPTKNMIHPSEIHPGSNDKFWWLCNVCGHEWQISVISRTGTKKTGCPKCSSQFKTSFAEQAIYYYLRKIFPDAKNRELIEKNEIDIYLPSLKVGIEYDGVWYHKSETVKKREERKNKNLKKLGIHLIRVKEVKESNDGIWFDDSIIYYSVDNGTEYLNDVIYQLILKLCPHYSEIIDVEQSRIAILEQYKMERRAKSLASLYPELVKEWHPTKNGNLTPEMFTQGSREEIVWVCQYGHEWKARISHRCSGSGCPYCAGRKVWRGFNDLETLAPYLAEEWNFEKNAPLLPSQVTVGSGKKVWWKCKTCGHEWKAVIHDRKIGTGCPACYKKKNKR